MFNKNKHFGVWKNLFTFVLEGMNPAVDLDGKIIMPSTSEIKIIGTGKGTIMQKINEHPKMKGII